MKLALDEHISCTVAQILRGQGYDVVALTETELGNRGVIDDRVLEWAAREGRVVVTYNVKDFARLAASWMARQKIYPGMVFVKARTVDPADLGALARRLKALMDRLEGMEWTEGTCLFL